MTGKINKCSEPTPNVVELVQLFNDEGLSVDWLMETTKIYI